MKDIDSLAHTKWRCQYHGVEIIEANACEDHIHKSIYKMDTKI